MHPNESDIFQYPMQTYGYGILFSISGYIGLAIVLTMVKSFGALIAVTGRFSVKNLEGGLWNFATSSLCGKLIF